MGLFVSSSRTKIDVFGAISQCSSRLFLFSYVQRTSAEFSRWQDLSVNTAPAKCEAAWADLRACLTERIQGGHAKSGPALLDSWFEHLVLILSDHLFHRDSFSFRARAGIVPKSREKVANLLSPDGSCKLEELDGFTALATAWSPQRVRRGAWEMSAQSDCWIDFRELKQFLLLYSVLHICIQEPYTEIG